MVFIYGNDKRQKYLGDFFENDGYPVIRVPFPESINTLEITEAVSDASSHADLEVLIFPVPAPSGLYPKLLPFVHNKMMVFGGNIPDEVFEAGERYGTKIFDYMKVPSVAIKNAVSTAEGAICEAMQTSDITLSGSKCLVAGYGKCGSVLCEKLLALHSSVDVLETNTERQAMAITAGCKLFDGDVAKFDYIFNTVPAPILNNIFLHNISNNCTIIDIASGDGGTDFALCEKCKINAKHTLGLPAKYAPKSAAEIIFMEIKKEIPKIF